MRINSCAATELSGTVCDLPLLDLRPRLFQLGCSPKLISPHCISRTSPRRAPAVNSSFTAFADALSCFTSSAVSRPRSSSVRSPGDLHRAKTRLDIDANEPSIIVLRVLLQGRDVP